jgi:hypothetical protein
VVRWRLIDLCQWIFEEFRITISLQTLSRELRAMGYRRLSARPRREAHGRYPYWPGASRMVRRPWFFVGILTPSDAMRTSLSEKSNRSPLCRNGNWKIASRDRRPKPAPQEPKCQKLRTRDWGTPA